MAKTLGMLTQMVETLEQRYKEKVGVDLYVPDLKTQVESLLLEKLREFRIETFKDLSIDELSIVHSLLGNWDDRTKERNKAVRQKPAKKVTRKKASKKESKKKAKVKKN